MSTWCALSTVGIIGRFILENWNRTEQSYRNMFISIFQKNVIGRKIRKIAMLGAYTLISRKCLKVIDFSVETFIK